MTADPTVFVVLPAHDRVAITTRCAECLAAQSYRDFRLLLIDDGSTDGTAQAVCKLVPATTVLRGDGNLWWAGSLQKGCDWLRESSLARPEDLVLFINDDTVFDPVFLGNAVAAMRGRSRTLLLAQQFSQQTGKYLESGVRVDWARLTFTVARSPEEVNCLSTRGLFLRVRDLAEIGPFYTRLLPHYGSDYEYTIRAHRKGFSLASSPEVRLWDNEKTTGIRSTEGQSAWTVLRSVFLKQNQTSPYYWSMFVLLACPVRYWPLSLARIWVRFARRLARAPWVSGPQVRETR